MKSHLLSMLGVLLLSSAAFAIVDANNNGVSDLWEKKFNDGVLFSGTFDPQADPDADGWTNIQEAAAGTDPLEPNPPNGVIRPDIVRTPVVFGEENGQQIVVSPEVVTVSWPTIPGKRYILFFSPDLDQGSWIEVPQSDFIGDGDIPEFHFTTAESDKLFWRVAVSDTDSDEDGMTDAEENSLGTNANWWDSDGDGIGDLEEVLNGYSPLIGDENSNGVSDGWDDSDQDGYSDLEELASGTDPGNPSSKPDGISSDILLVRGTNSMLFRTTTTPVTRIGACGAKDFAFRELKPTETPTAGMTTSYPKFYLEKSEVVKLRQVVDFHRTSILWGSGGIYPDITDLIAYAGSNEEETSQISMWNRGTPSSPNNAAVPYLLHGDDDFQVERSLLYTEKPYSADAPFSTQFSYRTGDPEEEDFDFSIWTNGSEDPAVWDTYGTDNSISEDSPDLLESVDSVSGYASYSGDFASFRDSYARTQSSKTTLTEEYTDSDLAADVDEALGIARATADGGGSPGITGSASINGRGIADHQWSDDHINHLKMDSLVNFSTTVSQTGVRKVVFLWTEIHRPDPASPGEASPVASLKVRRVVKSSATPFSIGTTVTTDDIGVIHPAEPGCIEIPGPSTVEGPDQLQATQGSQTANPPHGPLKPLVVHSSLSDRAIAVTLEATGNGQVRLWRKQNESFSEVSLPYSLEAAEKAGQTSLPAALHIQGLAPGNVHLALKAQGQEIAFKDIRVIEFDLDTDSDNSGVVDVTTSEDLIEFTASDPGLILSCSGGEDADADGTPNRDDLDDAGEFAPIKFALANLTSSERVTFHYSAAGLGTQSVAGSLRLWRKNGTSGRTANDLILSGGQGYTASDLGVSGGGTVTLYLETVSDLGGLETISVEAKGASDMVKVSTIAIRSVSRDKYLAGSFEIPAGWNDLSVSFINTSSQEDLGSYGSLTGGGTTKIYDSVDGIMNDADILAGSQPATQKVWFVRSPENPRKLDFYTCFNSVGTVEIRLSRGGQTILTRSHPLTTADDFAETIRYVDDWVKGVGFEFSGGGTPPVVLGAPTVNGFGGGDGGIDNLTRAALIPFFNVINQVEGLQNIAVGLFDGVKAGLNDDWQLLLLVKSGAVVAGGWAWQHAETELLEWKNNPIKRAGELKDVAMKVCKDWVFDSLKEKRHELSTWGGFKNESWKVWQSVKGTAAKAWTVTRNSWGDICNGFSSWMDDYGARMIEGAEKTHWSESVFPMTKFQQIGNAATTAGCYALGYSTGYITEQVVVGVVTGGVVKAGTLLTKGGVKMAGLLAARRVLPVAARLQLVKKWAASVAVSIEFKAAVERGLAASAELPLSAVLKDSVAEVIERGMARATYARTVFTTGHILDEVILALNIRKLILTPGREGQFWHKFALFFDVMEDKATAEASKGWVKAYDRLLKFGGDVFEEDRAGDLLALYKAEGNVTGKEALRKSLEDFAANANPAALHPDLRFLDIDAVASKGYRYTGEIDWLADRGWSYPAHDGGGWYCTLDEFADSLTAKGRLQLPVENSARYKIEFEIAPVKPNSYVPYGRLDNAPWFEPLARDYPEFGIGGATQFLVKDSEITISRVVDMSTNPPSVIFTRP